MKKIFVFIILLAFPILVFATDKVDINSATLQQLDVITGVGPAIAQKIINARPFSSVDDLVRETGLKTGIGPKTLQKIKDQGVACVNCTTEIASSATPNVTLDPSPTPSVIPAEAGIQTPSPTPAIIYPTGVFINEIMPNPAGADETNEWIELKNSTASDIDLSGWQLQDQQGTITKYTIPTGTKILANNFLVFKRPDTKIMLNNEGDGINLLTPDNKVEDSMIFEKAPLNQSYNKSNSAWNWSTTATPGSENIITTLAKTTKTTANTLSKSKKSDNNKTETATADLSQNAGSSTDSTSSLQAGSGQANPMLLFFIALATAIVLGVAVLFIKLKFKKNVRT